MVGNKLINLSSQKKYSKKRKKIMLKIIFELIIVVITFIFISRSTSNKSNDKGMFGDSNLVIACFILTIIVLLI